MDFSSYPEYDAHKLMLRFHDPNVKLTGYIAIHRGNALRPAFGATRLWKYETEESALRDAMRLSRGMSRKSALAGLKYGGGKAVIMEPGEPYDRKALLKSYARFVQTLNGLFVTGTDVGLLQEDVLEMKKYSQFFVGAKVDPTYYTVQGIIRALQATLDFLYQSKNITGRRFAIQGAGKIGTALVEHLADKAERVYVSDFDTAKLDTLEQRFPNITAVVPEDIHKCEVDIFSPCALGCIINEKTIDELNCKAVVGGANDQLADEQMSEELQKRGILYAPDYIVNAGGLMSVVSEYESGRPKHDKIEQSVAGIYKLLYSVYTQSSRSHMTTNLVAEDWARTHLETFLNS